MLLDAKMIPNQTDNEWTGPEVFMERTRVRTGTEGIVHGSDSVEQKPLHCR